MTRSLAATCLLCISTACLPLNLRELGVRSAVSLVKLLPLHLVLCTLAAPGLIACDGDQLQPRTPLFTPPANPDAGDEPEQDDDGDTNDASRSVFS